MTAEQFFEWANLSENDNKCLELVRGEVIELPVPMKRHGVVCGNTTRILGNFTFRRAKGYVASNDAGVILERDPDTVRSPDVALYEDATAFVDLHPKYGEVVPRLAVEILSPNDRADYITRKITDYLRNGVELVWVIDPVACTITVYRADSGPTTLEKDQVLKGDPVLPGFRCRVADFFLLPGEPPAKAAPRRRRKP
jgi:Uma2 family endonuclease